VTLIARLTMSPVGKGGSPVIAHGATGHITQPVALIERFRRPGAQQAGYQTIGRDVQASTLQLWFATTDAAAAKLYTDSLEALQGTVVKLAYKEHTSLPVVVTRVEITRSSPTRGSIISGATAATWRVEASVTVEPSP
jgi:hypothetical protein